MRCVGINRTGSSPLARGLRQVDAAVLHKLTDHPRSRGVYLTARQHRRMPRRIIPARAGFTPPLKSRCRSETDHPRSRGVYWPGSPASGPAAGSSPLARGLRAGDGLDGESVGIIPARAGFTGFCRPVPSSRRDHPRSRGVYRISTSPGAYGSGSSPLARGLPDALNQLGDAARIIPARAGFTSEAYPRRRRRRDHPRSRGVYDMTMDVRQNMPGSSPLARGLRQQDRRVDTAGRIIPARAGFTPRR